MRKKYMTEEDIADVIKALIINESNLENGENPMFTGVKSVSLWHDTNTIEIVFNKRKQRKFIITVARKENKTI